MGSYNYPTKVQLKRITNWKCSNYNKAVALAEYVCNLWHWSDWASLTGKRVLTLRLVTGGWSGNEDIVSAFRKNVWFSIYWCRSERGGLHIYKIKPLGL